MLKRPLMWVGLSFLAGEAAIYGLNSLWAGRAAIAAALAAYYMIMFYFVGRKRAGVLLLLPVFFLGGCFRMMWMMYLPETILPTGSIQVTGYVNRAEYRSEGLKLQVCTGDDTKRNYIVYTKEDIPEKIYAGDTVEIYGTAEAFETAPNPGGFDAKSYYGALGIDGMLYAETLRCVVRGHGILSAAGHLSVQMAGVFERVLSEKDSGIIKGMLLGDKAMLDADTKTLFQRMGIAHILAISGLHISLVGMSLLGILRRAGCPAAGAALTADALVIFYGIMTGFPLSAKRAVLMFIIMTGAECLGRCYDMLTAIALSGMVLMFFQPMLLVQAGTLFSFAAVSGLALLWQEIYRVFVRNRHTRIKRMENHGKKGRIAWKTVGMAVGPSFCVTLATMPLMAWFYYEIPTYSIALNLLVIPLMSLLVPLGMFCGIIGQLLIGPAVFAGGSLHAILSIYELLSSVCEEIPGSVIVTGRPPGEVLWLYYGCLLVFVCVLRGTADRKSILLLTGCIVLFMPWQRSGLSVSFLDVGQGDGIVIHTVQKMTILIDGGSSDEKEIGRYRIIPFLHYYGIGSVDYAIMTHSDEDHISGIRELLQEKRICHLLLPKLEAPDEAYLALVSTAKDCHVPVIYYSTGDAVTSGQMTLTCIYTGLGTDFTSANDLSGVWALTSGTVDMLFTGDISSAAEAEILHQYPEKSCEVLKAAHHGSKYSSSEAFLKWAAPESIVISSGRNNRYGHPHQETLERFEASGGRILMTMETGAVLMQWNGKSLTGQNYRTGEKYVIPLVK